MKTEFYCPKCSETSHIDPIYVAPPSVEITCPSCGTMWRVEMEFHEIESLSSHAPNMATVKGGDDYYAKGNKHLIRRPSI